MELIEHRCKRCGGELKNIGEGRWSCPYCSCVYDEAVVQKNTKSLHEEFDEVKREIVCNLRRNLYDAVNEEYISSEKLRECAAELKKYLPDDFAACFYEVAVSNNVKQLTKQIRRINVEENYSEIECVIRFLIKSLQTEYLLELNNLVERAYKQRDLVLFEKYSTEISLEAEKVENGVYETKMPRDVFIAYSSKDMETVSELCEVLEGQGLKCFVAARNLRHGKGSVENYDKLLCEAMDHCKTFVFVSSTNSRSFSCDALIKELPYIQERDIENAPAEHKNNYASMPHSYKKPRVEYRIEESRGFSAPDAISNEFFDGYERVYSPEAVAERVAKQILLAAEKKAVKKPTPAPAAAPVIVQSAPAEVGGQRIEPLLKRAAIFIDDGEWEDAEAYCEKALDIDPECAQAYIYKLMIDLQVKSQDELANCKESFEDNTNFKRVLRFADEETAALLKGYIDIINERNENERKDKIYNLACSLIREGTVDSYTTAISKLGEIPNYKDSQELLKKCRQTMELVKQKKAEKAERERIAREKEAQEAKILAKKTLKISAICVGAIALVIVIAIILSYVVIPAIKTSQGYKDALSLMDDGEYKQAIKILNSLDGYKDSAAKIEECQTAIKDIAYDEALALMTEGKYAEAIVAFEAMNGYKDSVAKIEECQTAIKDISYDEALALMTEGKYAEALEELDGLNGYKDSATKIEECQYNVALTYMTEGKYDEAIAFFEVLNNYKDSAAKIEECEEYLMCEFELNSSGTEYTFNRYNGNSNSVVIPSKYNGKSVTSIGAHAFNGCSSLASVTIPDSVTSIGRCAFYNCDSLASVTIPDSVTSIGEYAFDSCSSLTSVTIPDSVTSIGYAAFTDCSSLISVTIPDSVTSIGEYAFDGCSSLASVTMPDSVTSIGSYAFRTCSSLTSVLIPDSVTSIGDVAFSGCSSLVSVTIPDSVTSIGNYAFNFCSSLENVMIPDSVTSIGKCAFYTCSSLTSVTIPDSVTSIGSSAFSGCSSLTSVYYTGSKSQWQQISIDSYNGYLTGANNIVYNYDPN